LDSLFLFAALAVLIVFMFRSNQKRKKQAEELQASIAVGANVMLTSGIYGEIKSIDGDRLVIETTPGTKLSVIKLAVREIVSAPEPKVKKTTAKAEPSSSRAAAKPAAKKTAK
jgi:preprotein translocase subunit YajC